MGTAPTPALSSLYCGVAAVGCTTAACPPGCCCTRSLYSSCMYWPAPLIGCWPDESAFGGVACAANCTGSGITIPCWVAGFGASFGASSVAVVAAEAVSFVAGAAAGLAGDAAPGKAALALVELAAAAASGAGAAGSGSATGSGAGGGGAG